MENVNSHKEVTGRCPKCGGKLSIPQELSQFSCMYCGARMTMTEFLSKVDEQTDENTESNFRWVKEHIPQCITEHRDLIGKFGRYDYESSFSNYSDECSPILKKFDDAVAASPDRAKLIRDAAAAFLDGLMSDWERKPNWKRKSTRMEIMDNDKMVLAVFTIPMIRRLALPVSEEFAAAIRDDWITRYPSSPILLGSYDEIMGGFKRWHKLCFITSAACQFKGLPDNCRQLMALRGFRDGYLASSPDGNKLIAEYYEIAPAIVTGIRLFCDEKRYEDIWNNYIVPCVDDIENGRPEGCRDRYVRLINELRHAYLRS